MKKLFTAAAPCVFVIAVFNLPAAELVRDSVLLAEIIIPEKSNPVERYAAEELVRHLKKITGLEFPVRTTPTPGKKHIRLGRSAVTAGKCGEPNTWMVKIGKAHIDLAGCDSAKGDPLRFDTSAGTLFAVYDFLHNELGVRWLWPGADGTVLKKRTALKFAPSERNTGVPLRFVQWRQSTVNRTKWENPGNADVFLRNTIIWLRRHRFGMSGNLNYGHAFTKYWEKYGKSKPEIFNLLPDGRRHSDPYYFDGMPSLISMCVSSPELHKIILSGKRRSGIINLNENDTAGKCVCARCLKWDGNPDDSRVQKAAAAFRAGDRYWYKKLGSVSDRYASFIAEIRKFAKHELIIAGIYANYTEPPTGNIHLDKNVIMRYCPPLMYPWTLEKMEQAKRVWQGWNNTGASMMFRPNFTLDGHNFPLDYHRDFVEIFDFARLRGMAAVDLDSLTGAFGANAMTLYTIAAKCGEGYGKSCTEIEDEFFSAFGAGEKFIREYFRAASRCTAEGRHVIKSSNAVEGSSIYASFFMVADKIFIPGVMQEMEKYLDQAETAVKNDPPAAGRVQFLRNAFEDCKLTLAVQHAYNKYKTDGDVKVLRKQLKSLKKHRTAFEHTGYLNVGYAQQMETRFWPWNLLAVEDDAVPLSTWFVSLDVRNNDFSSCSWQKFSTDTHLEKQPAGREWKSKPDRFTSPVWYRTGFTLSRQEAENGISLKFGAVDGSGEYFVNGRLIHRRPYPYMGDPDSWKKDFSFNVPSSFLNTGENVLMVKLTKKQGLSGIWRAVYRGNPMRERVPMTENLLKDGSCSGAVGTVWKKDVREGSFTFETRQDTEASSGKTIRIKCTGTDKKTNRSFGRIYQTFAVEPGSYTFRIRFRTDLGFTGKVLIYVRAGGKGLSESNRNLASMGTDGKWKELFVDFSPRNRKGTVYINLQNGTGTCVIDEVQIYRNARKMPEAVK